jgi:hypothetical protein
LAVKPEAIGIDAYLSDVSKFLHRKYHMGLYGILNVFFDAIEFFLGIISQGIRRVNSSKGNRNLHLYPP